MTAESILQTRMKGGNRYDSISNNRLISAFANMEVIETGVRIKYNQNIL